ncbi:hypothetical protein C0J50_20592 [Silurus asotus]|uniref:Uncharacterized protein n=1 Tax=Silurus asotus TaxID=30991 RepID=A0AAD5FKD0_SILAS|nr:hypothetical protein C0J50_20592 [Silurus asotus]
MITTNYWNTQGAAFLIRFVVPHGCVPLPAVSRALQQWAELFSAFQWAELSLGSEQQHDKEAKNIRGLYVYYMTEEDDYATGHSEG